MRAGSGEGEQQATGNGREDAEGEAGQRESRAREVRTPEEEEAAH